MSNIYNDIQEWIERISGDNPICPYAQNAEYLIFENEDQFSMQIKACNYKYNADLILCIPTDKYMSVEKAQYIEYNINRISEDTITLLDHPEDPGFIEGQYTGNGKHIIFLIQPKKELLKARKVLETKGYYDNWAQEYKEKICRTHFY